MRIVYYSHPAFFEPALSLVEALSREAEVHLILEITPGSWTSAAFDVRPVELGEGLVDADPVLRERFPERVSELWRSAASFQLAVHRHRRSLHPRSWRISRRVLRHVEQLDADVLHVDDVDVTPRLALALPGWRASVPILINVHDPEPHAGEHNWRKSLARRLAFPSADHFLLFSEQLIAPFRERYGLDASRVSSTRLGVYDLLAEATEVEEEFPTILFFGRLSRYKGLEVLYEALPKVAERVPGVRLVVAGGAVGGYQPPPPPLLAPPSRVEIRDRYIPNAELARLIGQSSVVVCPYREATQSGVVLTAYGFGKPVVATAVGGLSEYVVPCETGLLVPPGDADRLAEALATILLDSDLRERLGAGVRAARRTTLDWARTAGNLLHLYRNLGE